MNSRSVSLLALTLCASCASLVGRTADDASVDGDVMGDAAARDDRPMTVDAVVPRSDVPRSDVPPSDAPSCARGPAPVVDSRQFGVVAVAASHPLASLGVRNAATDALGRVYIVGGTTVGGVGVGLVARFGVASLVLDDTFGDHGVVVELAGSNGAVTWYAIAIDAMGRAVVAGDNGVSRSSAVVSRFTAEGARDVTFGGGGVTRVATSRVPGGADAVFAYGLHLDGERILVTGGDGPAYARPSQRAIVFRLTPDGSLDDTFGTGGVFTDATILGCYDVQRDGPDEVLACISESERPLLLKLDASGQRVGAFGNDGASENTFAPTGFQARSLQRDSSGRWLIAGAVSPFYDDVSATPAAVRFLADGTPDATWGDTGVALALGVRHSFAYTFAESFLLTCDDRLLYGATAGVQPLVGAFDREGRRVTTFGPSGYLRGPLQARTYVDVSALLPLPGGGDAIVVHSLHSGGVGFSRLAQ